MTIRRRVRKGAENLLASRPGRMQVPKEDVQSVVDEILDARHNVSVKPKTIEELVEEAVAKAMAKYTEQPTPQRGRGKKTASVPPQTEQATS